MGDKKFINYNFMSRPARFCLDISDEIYRSVGVSRVNKNSFDLTNLVDGDILFVKTDFIYSGEFQSKYLPNIDKKFILVTGISDYSVESGHPSYVEIINNPNLIKWFCTNPPNLDSEKIEWLPVGFQEKERQGGDLKILNKQFNSSTDWVDKENKVYIPFHTTANSIGRERLINEISKNDFCVVEKNKLDFDDYLTELNKYKYVLSLRGNGWDCHRHYESLLVGSVPVLENGPILESFKSHELPVLSLDEINTNMFNKEFNFLNVKDFLTMGYHINKIKETI